MRACAAEDCDRTRVARGFCKTHYNRWHEQQRPTEPCTVDGCDAPIHGHGRCKVHHRRWQRHGTDVTDPVRTRGPGGCGTIGGYWSGCRCDSCTSAQYTYKRAWRAANPDYGRAWKAANPDKVRNYRRQHNGKRRAAIQGGDHEPYDPADIFQRDRWRCQLCHRKLSAKPYPHPKSATIDHIVPLSQGGDDKPANVQAAHLECNLSKGVKPQGEQLRLVG